MVSSPIQTFLPSSRYRLDVMLSRDSLSNLAIGTQYGLAKMFDLDVVRWYIPSSVLAEIDTKSSKGQYNRSASRIRAWLNAIQKKYPNRVILQSSDEKTACGITMEDYLKDNSPTAKTHMPKAYRDVVHYAAWLEFAGGKNVQDINRVKKIICLTDDTNLRLIYAQADFNTCTTVELSILATAKKEAYEATLLASFQPSSDLPCDDTSQYADQLAYVTELCKLHEMAAIAKCEINSSEPGDLTYASDIETSDDESMANCASPQPGMTMLDADDFALDMGQIISICPCTRADEECEFCLNHPAPPREPSEKANDEPNISSLKAIWKTTEPGIWKGFNTSLLFL